jgi:uncharacterized membrane protein
MQTKKGFLAVVFTLLPFGYAIYLYPSLGDQIPIHFNIEGKADGWASRNSIFIMPVIMGFVSVFIFLLLTNIEKFDPKARAANIKDTLSPVAIFISGVLCALTLVVLYGISHEHTPIDQLLFGVLGLLFIGMGYYMPNMKQNYFAGYKLPWTLENEENWKKTHGLAGKYWIAGGALQVLLAIFLSGEVLFYIFMTITILVSLFPILYSYSLFKKNKQGASK